MKKILLLQLVLFSVLLTGCKEKYPLEEEPELIEINSEDFITMDMLDQYMERSDVQYVDLRNIDAKFNSGYIRFFESIPFFEYLDNRAFVRNGTYEFNADQIINEHIIKGIFDKEKAIFLYADGCVRSGYLRDVLYHLGYERVYILGGFYEYEGEYKVLGDGSFNLGTSSYLVHVANDGITYRLGATYDMTKSIIGLRIDIVDSDGISMRSENYSNTVNYNEQLTILEDYIVSQYTNLYTVHSYLSDDILDNYDDIDGYSLGFDQDLIALFGK